MKDLKVFVSESKKEEDIIKKIEDIAWGAIDWYNQEGVKNYDEQDWIKYVNGDKDPDFKDFISTAMVDCAESDKEVLDLLKKYPKTDLKEDIEIAILRAAQDYVKDIM